MSAEKPHGDGTGSYSFNTCTCDFKSWLPNPYKVFNDMTEHMEDKMKDIEGTKIQIIAFNRI